MKPLFSSFGPLEAWALHYPKYLPTYTRAFKGLPIQTRPALERGRVIKPVNSMPRCNAASFTPSNFPSEQWESQKTRGGAVLAKTDASGLLFTRLSNLVSQLGASG
ncbi:hypothetical protein D5086_004960 [Populus alba]|uniref:Uncharacterized protein n=3 Tax=Populus TaxID=3689 RepID=A0A4U5Q7C8_POPAL|nr:hypothetical protein NC653_006624 [Populus alba x Populus x berolinensis]TKS06178.1 hypothetical protein D5086_0000124940 [Populus alba]